MSRITGPGLGEPAPGFATPGVTNPRYVFDTAAGRYLLLAIVHAEYDGGDLRFPEFGDRTYRPPPGGACVFSCSMLHEATPVTRGERFAFLPFLYDEAAAAIREANLKYLDPALSA